MKDIILNSNRLDQLNNDQYLTEKEKIIPLKYNSTINISLIKNILLIDSNVQESNKFYENCNETTYPIIYSYNSDKEELKTLLSTNFTNLDRLAIVTHNSSLNDGKQFLNNQSLFLEDDLKENITSYSENMQFIIDTIKTYKINIYNKINI
jgi:hypothetical protein